MSNQSAVYLFDKIATQEKESIDFGFYWENIEQILQQIKSECHEIAEAWHSGDKTHLKEEVGDVMNATISLAIFCNIDPFEALKENTEKYQNRFDALVQLVKQDNLDNLKNKPMEILLDYWNRAKQKCSK